MLSIRGTEHYKSEKIVSYAKAVKLIQQFRIRGKKIGLCHGAFDMLHPGHIRHFQSAKKLCDILFVSITKDKFVSQRKGSHRPVYTDKLRAYAAASVEFVDYAVISNYKTAIEVIKTLKPDYYIKGPDFINKRTPGIEAEKEAIIFIGGKLLCTKDPKFSTTELINYIKYSLNDEKMLVVIDRDGTLIEKVDFLGKENDWKSRIRLRNDVLSLIHKLQTKFNTTKIVATNQSGVARGYFDCKKVEEINSHLDNMLKKNGVKIDMWNYCPCVDKKYADSLKGEIKFIKKFITGKSKRKPGTDMIVKSLKEMGLKLDDFKRVIVIGDSEDDRKLSENLCAEFIDANKPECCKS